ncbi:MAG: Acetyltransferase [Chthonomonadaceae bacterium]|nr:Acetyltransferase [Chthonomonadaceae bacterium]
MIRPYQISDTESIIEVWHAAAVIAHDFVPDAFWQTERDALRNTYLDVAETCVYVTDDRVVGFLSLLGDEIGGLFILPAYQGQGIGTRLVQHARTIRGDLFLRVFKRNVRAIHFYESCGFVAAEENLHEPTSCILLTMRSR